MTAKNKSGVKYTKASKAEIISNIEADLAALRCVFESLGYPIRIRGRDVIRAVYSRRDPALCWFVFGKQAAIKRETIIANPDAEIRYGEEINYSVDYVSVVFGPETKPTVSGLSGSKNMYGEYGILDYAVQDLLSYLVDYNVSVEDVDIETVISECASGNEFEDLLTRLIVYEIVSEKTLVSALTSKTSKFLADFVKKPYRVRISPVRVRKAEKEISNAAEAVK